VRLGPKTAFVVVGGRGSCLRGQQISPPMGSLPRCQIKVTSAGWAASNIFYRALAHWGVLWGGQMMDELQLEELSVRMTIVKMDDAFCEALERAIDAGTENSPTVVSKQPGARNPKHLPRR
jgi:hypothetical protein